MMTAMESHLLEKLGQARGASVWERTAAHLQALEGLCDQENAENAKTMRTQILPRIALYRALQETSTKEQAYAVVWDYTKTCLCAPTRERYGRLERVPFFRPLFRLMFLRTMLHGAAWEGEAARQTPDGFGVDIHRCLWWDTCQNCQCPELCRVFCDSDWENFGHLRKLTFHRTQSLGTGGERCDFRFCEAGKQGNVD